MKNIIIVLLFLNSYTALGIIPILRISYDLNLKLSYGIGLCINGGDYAGSEYRGIYFMHSKSFFGKSNNTSLGLQSGVAGGFVSSQLGINKMNIIDNKDSKKTYWGLELNVHPLLIDYKLGLMAKEPYGYINDLKINASIGLGI